MRGAAAAPVLIQSAPGRFEISAVDPTLAHGVAAAAEEAWRYLGPSLMLSDGFTSPIYFRVVAAEELDERTPFRVNVEVGGLVSARLRSTAATLPMVRRALVQSLLMRLAVARHGAAERLTVPLWLELAAVEGWQTRADAAYFDGLKQVSKQESPPTVEAILGWQRGAAGETEAHSRGAFWLFSFLQGESGREREWPELLLRLLKGDDPLLALAVSYPGRFNSAEARELWWRTGYHHLCRVRTLPVLDAVESRHALGALARFVFAGEGGDTDRVLPLADVLARGTEPLVVTDLMRRIADLARLVPNLHPFYRNAGLSLAEAFAATPAKRDRACAVFDADWRDARELEAAAGAALDALENAVPARRNP